MKLQINETSYEVDAEADTPLLWVIRDDLASPAQNTLWAGAVRCLYRVG
ncbi:hypothetical protein [Serratia odorifera]|nr:hypothetical protein [Serratia odorifera]